MAIKECACSLKHDIGHGGWISNSKGSGLKIEIGCGSILLRGRENGHGLEGANGLKHENNRRLLILYRSLDQEANNYGS